MARVLKIEVCINNLLLGSEQVCQRIRASYPEIEIKQWNCLGHCDRCIRVPYVVIDDNHYLEAEDPAALWQQVQAYIEANRIELPLVERD